MPARISRRKLSDYFAGALLGGTSVRSASKELAGYLIDTKRTKEVGLITRDIEYALSQKGYVVADIISASTLSETTQKEIIALAKKTFAATNVELRDTIDPTVIGGVKIDFAGLQMDTTIKQKLTALRANHKV